MRFKLIVRILSWAVFFALGYLLGKAHLSRDVEQVHPEHRTETISEVVPLDVEATEIRTDLNEEEKATINLFESSAPSVVFISTSNFRQDFWTRDITEIPSGSGSGFIWDNKGHIVTNLHVIQDADKAIVTLADQTSYEADLVGYALEKDLAILKIDAPRSKLIPIPIGESENLLVGQSVFAIGNPFGLDQTLTTGIISALGREIKARSGVPIRDVIQTDAAINPGNSGGPLLDSNGKLIGVNTAIYSPSGAYAGIGFSIPVDQVNWVVSDLIEFGYVQRPTLGVGLFNQSTVSRAGLKGAVIRSVEKGSGAEKAGIKPAYRNDRGRFIIGDIITGVEDEEIKTNNDLQLALENFKEGDRVMLLVRRDEKEIKIPVVLGSSRQDRGR